MLTGVVDRKVGSADLGGEPEGNNESNERLGGEHRSEGCNVLAEHAEDLKQKALGRVRTFEPSGAVRTQAAIRK